MRHNIVIEHVKKNGGAFSTLKKIATEGQLRTANSICMSWGYLCIYYDYAQFLHPNGLEFGI